MGFRGRKICSLDKKNRFLFPKELKDKLPSDSSYKFILINSFDGTKSLYLYPLENWQKFEKALLKKPLKKDVIKFRNFILGNLVELEMDKNGRLLIPQNKLDFINAKNEILIFGDIDKFQIWAPEEFERYNSTLDFDPEEILKDLYIYNEELDSDE